MNIKRFFAKTSREALSQVRRALGEEAVILSNRAVEGGTEIMAVKANDMAHFAETASASGTNNLNSSSNSTQQQIDILTRKSSSLDSGIASKSVLTAPTASQTQAEVTAIKREIQSMHQLLQSQLGALAWNQQAQRDPMKSVLMTTLLSAGFSVALSRVIAEKAPALSGRVQAFQWLKSALANNLKVLQDERNMLDHGGVFALVGPTGVGKTTTTAKLAARYVMKHGTQNLALITTDAYRIGGHEQLRIYGKILGVMVHAVKDQDDLKLALQELKGKHTILIDTVGVSQRDSMVAQQIAMLHQAGPHIQKILCLNATSTGETLSDVVMAYKGKGIDGAILTKTDEAATLGGALDIVIREKLQLYYLTNGQRVPEDILMVNKEKLLMQALKLGVSKQQQHGVQSEELPALIAHAASQSSALSKEMSHV